MGKSKNKLKYQIGNNAWDLNRRLETTGLNPSIDNFSPFPRSHSFDVNKVFV